MTIADPDDAELATERAARDRAIDGCDEIAYEFHETRIDDLLHLRRLREHQMAARFACDNDAAEQLSYRIGCIERGQSDPG